MQAKPELFADVKNTAWSANGAYWVAEQRIIVAYAGGSFDGSNPIKREEAAAILWRLEGEPSASGAENTYSDSKEGSEILFFPMRWAIGEGILTVKAGNRLAPADAVSREEAAVIFERLCRKRVHMEE